MTVSRLSARNKPELINRAISQPLGSDGQWRSLYKATLRTWACTIQSKHLWDSLWESVIPGDCIAIDDDNHTIFEGATRAADESLATRTPRLFNSVPFGSAFIMK